MNEKLSNISVDYLSKSGWYKGRETDISEFEKIILNNGYSLNNYARQFLTEFGLLKGFHPSLTPLGSIKQFSFNSIYALANTGKGNVDYYEKRLGEKVTVVGNIHSNHIILMISDKGKMYGGYDDFLTMYGENMHDGLNTIFEGKRTKEIN